MNMTHYMELLADNQPWNLLIFMAIPVVLAETVAITELYILYTRKFGGWVRTVNRTAGVLVGLYFIGIIGYLMSNAVIPITRAGEWRTILDVIAVATYLIGGVPMILIALLELGILHRGASEEKKLGFHAIYVACFLVFAHVAMIAGMADPGLLGYQGGMSHGTPAGQHVMPDGTVMDGAMPPAHDHGAHR
ncbi:DUF6803 family protein [Zoogloea sp.]|uniref:DUF6803 family protein n=1 Tax=Zoogloea sp. TaxID=49181 RepID=UPI0035B385E3